MPNPSFEVYTVCPTSSGQIYNAFPWFQPNIPVSTTTSEYYNQCSPDFFGVPENYNGYQFARTGGAYAGIILFASGGGGNSDYREYIEVKLNSTLIAGRKYCVSFYLSLTHFSKYAVNAVGAYFSADSVLHNPPPDLLSYIPQVQNAKYTMLTDTMEWMEVRDTFVPAGGERYMTIGNFYPDSLTDTLLNYSTTNEGNSYYYIDDVSVYLCDSGNSVQEADGQIFNFSLYPNPAEELVVISWQLAKEETVSLSLYDILGNKVSEIINEKKYSGKQEQEFDVSFLHPGIYFVKLKVDGLLAATKKLLVVR